MASIPCRMPLRRPLIMIIVCVTVALPAACTKPTAKQAEQKVPVRTGGSQSATSPRSRFTPTAAAPVVHAPAGGATRPAMSRITRTFADPPLPLELRDDGGLAPLPPRPAVDEAITMMRPTFEAGPPSRGEKP
jgi:hypothetical protein